MLALSLCAFRLAPVGVPGAYCHLVAIVLWHDLQLGFDNRLALTCHQHQ
jgi:hypothetical protein